MKTPAVIYSRTSRILVSALVMASRLSPLVLLALLAFSPNPPSNMLRLIRYFSISCLVPSALVVVLRRALSAEASVEGNTLNVAQRSRQIEIPCDAVAAVEPWKLPLPAPGAWIRLPSGRRFQYGISLDDLRSVIESIVAGGGSHELRETLRTGAAAYAQASHAIGAWRWYHSAFKYVVFSLVPTLPLFRVHQWIAYGGTFGEYYEYGLKAYLLGLGVYWGAMIVYMVIWAAVLRAGAEIIAFPAAFAAPSQATRVRRTVEVLDRILYYAGVPAFILIRLTA